MIPTWVITSLVLVAGCIATMFLGSTLSSDPIGIGLIFLLVMACILCAATDSFPFLLAIGALTPYSPGIPFVRSFPALGIVVIWMALILFFRLSLRGYLPYRRSYNWFALVVFAWVPVRFLMSPIHQLGPGAGGAGISGAMPYFLYVLAAVILLFTGAVLRDRASVVSYLRWSFRIVFLVGNLLMVCAFIPATRPVLLAMNFYDAGDITEGVQRLVALPGYGLFLVQVALCPALFRLRAWHSAVLIVLGLAMILVGGNRCVLASVVIAIPFIFFLRKQSFSLIVTLFMMVAGIGCLRIAVQNIPEGEIPGFMRSFGVFDSRIDEASGADASAQWRYDVWQDGVKKILQSPLTGNGFGNLPQHLQVDANGNVSTDFETVLAAGMAHNGFVDASYGFGIPFAIALTLVILWFLYKESIKALTADRHDPELRDIHAFLASMFAVYPVLIYSALDLSVNLLWIYAAISCILSHLPRKETESLSGTGTPVGKYGYGAESRTPALYPYRQY